MHKRFAGYPERRRQLENIWESIVEIPPDSIELEVALYYQGNKLPDIHPSWETTFAQSWLNEPDEQYGPTSEHRRAKLVLPTGPFSQHSEKEMECVISEVITKNRSDGRPNIDWNIKFSDDRDVFIDQEGITPIENEWTVFSMRDVLNVIYSGMRYLPYADCQIARAVVRYISMATFGVYEVMDDAEGVEFEGAGVRGRGFCSPTRVRSALRDDFYSLVKVEKLNSDRELSLRDLLFAGRSIKTAYVFEKFIDLFVEDLIPTQAALGVEGLVIGVNPMRLEVMGES